MMDFRVVAYMVGISGILLAVAWAISPDLTDTEGGFLGCGISVVSQLGAFAIEWAHDESRYRRQRHSRIRAAVGGARHRGPAVMKHHREHHNG